MFYGSQLRYIVRPLFVFLHATLFSLYVQATATPFDIDHGTLNLNAWNISTTPLIKPAGNWRFFPNRLITPQQFSQAPPEGSIPLATETPWNHTIEQQAWPHAGHGLGTYWLEIQGNVTSAPIHLLVQRSCSSANVYFFPEGGASITPIASLGRVGSSPATSTPYAGPLNTSLPFSAGNVHHLLIQVSNFDFYTGGLCGEIVLGTEEYLDNLTTRNYSIQSMLIALVGIAAIYLLALFSQNRESRPTFWLMLMCLSAWAFFFSAGGLLELLANNQQRWLYDLRFKLIFLGLTWASLSLPMFYTHQFTGLTPQWIKRLSLYSCSLVTIVIVLAPTAFMVSLITPLIALWGFHLGLTIYLLLQANRARLPYSKAMLAAISPLLLTIPIEVANNSALNAMPTLSLYCLIFYIFVHSLILGRKFSDATALAEKLSTNLQAEVEQRTSELFEKNRKLERTQSELQQVNEALKKLSVTDGLTRIYNRMYFDQELRKEWRRSARLRKPIAILMIDVDHFKKLNDTAGHLAGDQALQQLAQILHNHFKRAGELVARYGGEEFVVMLPNTDQRKALAVAEGLRHTIEKHRIVYDGRAFTITISIGIASTTPSMRLTTDHLLAAADAALYQAKNKGRNRVEIIPLLPAHPQGQDRRAPK